VLPQWRDGVATAIVIAATLALVLLDMTDRGVRHFWEAHPLTVDTVAGLLVLGLTVLIVNQVIRRRQVTERSRAVAAQAGIVVGQAARAVRAVKSVQAGGEQGTAGDDVRTYMLMLLVAAPVLIESSVARRFLEEAQVLGAEMVRIVAPPDLPTIPWSGPPGGFDEAIERLRAAAAPLLAVLTADERFAVTDGSG
jgi:hypothetical protein